MTRAVVTLLVLVAAGCAREAAPADLDPAHTSCAFCRMAVSDRRFAAQIAAPGAEPVFFDDIGCLRDYLQQRTAPVTADAVAFVADHRTGDWVRASLAVFTRANVNTPMGGGIIAHASTASRDQDGAAAGGTAVTALEIFGPSGPPNGGAK